MAPQGAGELIAVAVDERVVGHDPLDADTVRTEEADCALQKRGRGGGVVSTHTMTGQPLPITTSLDATSRLV